MVVRSLSRVPGESLPEQIVAPGGAGGSNPAVSFLVVLCLSFTIALLVVPLGSKP